ncbi:MAG: glucosidase [Gammaproteobacteria bacterium]|nr:glucosidase [Gammaproteobacteria bacterium]
MNAVQRIPNAERQRLERARQGEENWRLWGPYLAERAWGTVREDYSAHGSAWEYFDHDQARSRVYRWNEDGLGGISDDQQRLCFALALWNGRDPILKERAFGLTGNQGNHGEDVKECYFYLDATPSHSYLRHLYKYPQAAYPYAELVAGNAARGRADPPLSLVDTGVFAEDRYFDVEIHYAKRGPTTIFVRIVATNRGPEAAPLHLVPQLWFRNTWRWGGAGVQPVIAAREPLPGTAWAVTASHETLGSYTLAGRQRAALLFTDNESNGERLWGSPNASPYVKDAFHRHIVGSESDAVNPALQGTKCGAWYARSIDAGQSIELELVLAADLPALPFEATNAVFARARSEADVFYDELLPEAGAEDHQILRQALAGMIWCKQFFHYDVGRWLEGDAVPPPGSRKRGRNTAWRHLRAAAVMSMPDAWEYPWFASWDLAYHCAALALVDVDFAKDQIELVLKETFLHPNGQIPAYEWAFGDANPPVHALGALKVFRAERVQRGSGDFNFLQRVFHKLLMNYAWWINRKDTDGNNVFEGGFLGLDNISVFDRSQPLPAGFRLKQSDATGWMAMFALNMTMMALELAAEDRDYEEVAIQTYEQFMAIANSIAGNNGTGLSLWDPDGGFFKDLVLAPDGRHYRIDVYSWVGLIPIFACEVLDERLLANVPRFRAVIEQHVGGHFQGHWYVSACPGRVNARGERLLALVDEDKLVQILARVLDAGQFLSPYGVRSVSRVHAGYRSLGSIPGLGETTIEYVPGESNSGLFGGNSNWRGPVWMPTNYTLVQALEKFHRFFGETLKIPVPELGGRPCTLGEIATLIAERLVDIFRRDAQGLRPVFPADSPLQHDPAWRDLLLFPEYFHGETGQGLGAQHQTGWTGLVANLVMRRYRRDIPEIWRAAPHAAAAEVRHAG